MNAAIRLFTLFLSATTCLAVPVLRRRADAPRGFRLRGGATIPALAAAISVWLLTSINRTQAIAGAAAMVAGIVLYFIFHDRGDKILGVNINTAAAEQLYSEHRPA